MVVWSLINIQKFDFDKTSKIPENGFNALLSTKFSNEFCKALKAAKIKTRHFLYIDGIFSKILLPLAIKFTHFSGLVTTLLVSQPPPLIHNLIQ